jgi:hypothetical protein
MKKTILILTMSVFGLLSHAEGGLGRGTFDFSDNEVALIRVEAKDINETSDVLTIRILCLDKRSQKNAITPKWETVEGFNELPICLNRPRSNDYDSVNKMMTVHFSLSTPQNDGQQKCVIHQKVEIDLRAFCDAWQR